MNRDEKERKKTVEVKVRSNLNFNIASLCSEKLQNNIAKKKYKCLDVAALYEGNSVTAVATEGT